MNLPFGISNGKENVIKKREEEGRSILRYERKLADYRDTLENYKNCIIEYSNRLDNDEKRSFSNQLSIIQTALDITYMKEQGDKVLDYLEDLKLGPINEITFSLEKLTNAIVDTNYKIEGLDDHIINSVSIQLAEFQKEIYQYYSLRQEELAASLQKLDKKVNKNNNLLWFLLLLNLISLAGLAFFVLI
jgi:hypothetical protein